ncbi:hypothetical protein U0070_008455 [Myodes glareolus]|uniref:Uncharacterized protein n=1 Tax=Myodes glareolus TaxID=447135 RepID=A0AAW0I5U4_MYOGA
MDYDDWQRLYHIDYIQRACLQYEFFHVFEDYFDLQRLYHIDYIHRTRVNPTVCCDIRCPTGGLKKDNGPVKDREVGILRTGRRALRGPVQWPPNNYSIAGFSGRKGSSRARAAGLSLRLSGMIQFPQTHVQLCSRTPAVSLSSLTPSPVDHKALQPSFPQCIPVPQPPTPADIHCNTPAEQAGKTDVFMFMAQTLHTVQN